MTFQSHLYKCYGVALAGGVGGGSLARGGGLAGEAVHPGEAVQPWEAVQLGVAV